MIAQAMNPMGYVVDGNHLFTLKDAGAVIAGQFRASVIEAPERHPAKAVRAAEILGRTYDHL